MANRISDYLVASDVDGTLLVAGYGVPRENLDAIEKFTARGGRFTICTGRGVESVCKLTEWIKLSAPAVLCNGTYIYDFGKNELLWSRPMEGTAREVVRDVLDMFPRMGVEITVEPRVYIARMNAAVEKHTASRHMRYTLAELEDIPDGWNKVVFTDSAEDLTPLEKYAERQCRNGGAYAGFEFIRTGPALLEIVTRGCNKGTGLLKLLELLGIDRKNTVAIGDYYNDKEFFEAAGFRISVADAPAEVRAMTDLTVSACLKGGVAEVLGDFDNIVGGYEQLSLEL